MAFEQLWLTVFDDHRISQWPPLIGDDGWRVALTASATIQGCDHEAPYRTSPVFPVSDTFARPTLEGQTLYFSFFCFDPAFPAIGRLLENAGPEIVDGLLFSLGLASVIHIGPNREAGDHIEQIVGEAPRSKEVWTVVDGRIRGTDPTYPKPADIDPALFRVSPYEVLPLVARTAVDEFVSSIALVLPKIAIHMPGESATFTGLVRLVDELIAEMVYVANPVGDPPATLSEYPPDAFTRDGALAEVILHQDTDRLVQVNAALSYLSTQALSGATPILERRSLIRRYSLLGVGTAVLALTRIARSIERSFSKGAIETILTDGAVHAAPLTGLEALPAYDPSDWPRQSINRWNGKVSPRPMYPKLPYFSGRLGFREGEYTISAALQALSAGAGPEWSLLTLTHEMLHGHVRNILSILLQGDPTRQPDEKWQAFYDEYKLHVEGDAPAEGFVQSLRVSLLAYCCLTITHGSLTRDGDMKRVDAVELRGGFWLPKKEPLWLLLEGELRNISEILVHVLDLHYFYLSNLDAYIPLIWRSWAPLPQVRGDLRQYLLRSLLVVASKTKGRLYDRFKTARSQLRELLEPLAAEPCAGASTLQHAVAVLRDDDECEKLFYPFRASLLLVDITHHLLTSTVIRGSLHQHDGHVVPVVDPARASEWLEYDLADDFVDDEVIAPTAYLADRLAKRLGQPESSSLEMETVRLFLACCSHNGLDGDAT